MQIFPDLVKLLMFIMFGCHCSTNLTPARLMPITLCKNGAKS